MYLILNKFFLHFQNLLEPERLTPYDVVCIIHRASFLRNPPTGFSKFINEFTSQVYLLIYEQKLPRISQELQDCLHPTTEPHIGDLLGPYTTHATPILLLLAPYKPTTIIVVPLH